MILKNLRKKTERGFPGLQRTFITGPEKGKEFYENTVKSRSDADSGHSVLGARPTI